MAVKIEIDYEQADEIAIASLSEHLQYLLEDMRLIERTGDDHEDMKDYIDIYDTAKAIKTVLAYYGKDIDMLEG